MKIIDPEILVPLTFILSVAGIIYIYLRSKHKERLDMIKEGVTADSLYSKDKTQAATLKRGMLLIGISIGLLLGYLIDNYFELIDSHIVYFVCIFSTGGLSLILNYRFEKNKEEKF